MSSQPTPPPSPPPSSPKRSAITPLAHRLPSMIPKPLRRHHQSKQHQPEPEPEPEQQQSQQSMPSRKKLLLSWLKVQTRETTQSILLARKNNTSSRAGSGGGGGGRRGGGDDDAARKATRIPLTERNVATFLAEMKRHAGGQGEGEGEGKNGRERGGEDEDEKGDRDGGEDEDDDVDEVFLDKERIRQKRRGQIQEVKERREKRVVRWLDGVR